MVIVEHADRADRAERVQWVKQTHQTLVWMYARVLFTPSWLLLFVDLYRS